MHVLGTHAIVELQRASGEASRLLDVPYSFHEQKVFDITALHPAAALELNPGDRILTTCTFDNTTAMTVSNGDQSSDEMCIMGIVAWPAGSLSNGRADAALSGFSQDQACF